MNRTITTISIALAAVTARGDAWQAIDFWVGEGASRSALVVDWDEAPGAGTSLVWGYRWDQPPTGEQMLRAVLAADQRFAAKIAAFDGLGAGVYGVGYDFGGDGLLDLSDGTVFVDGAASPADSQPIDTIPSLAATAIDPTDLYTEGFLTAGFWHYTAAPDPAGGSPAWVSSGAGASTRTLADGEWDGWTFTSYRRPDGSVKEFAELFLTSPDAPAAAPAPTEPGDFNRDGRVDAADYTAWRATSGSPVAVPGAAADGDFSGFVDAADDTLWRTHYGSTAPPPAAAVPEPHALILCSVTALPHQLRRKR